MHYCETLYVLLDRNSFLWVSADSMDPVGKHFIRPKRNPIVSLHMTEDIWRESVWNGCLGATQDLHWGWLVTQHRDDSGRHDVERISSLHHPHNQK